jgi:endonuclease-8
MPEGDSLHRAAERVGALVGEVVSVEAPHPRAAALGIAEQLDGRRLDRVEAVGKNLLLTVEGDVVPRSHLWMRGRGRVGPVRARPPGTPWLVVRGRALEAVLWHGPVLELGRGRVDRIGPDVMAADLDLSGMIRRFRGTAQERSLGEALLDQRLVAGIGNMWRAEALWLARLSPWLELAQVSDADLRRVLAEAARAMRAGRRRREAYRRSGLPCRRCGTLIRARALGEDARTAYWCPGCQAGTGEPGA